MPGVGAIRAKVTIGVRFYKECSENIDIKAECKILVKNKRVLTIPTRYTDCTYLYFIEVLWCGIFSIIGR